MKLSNMLNSALVFAAKKDIRYYLNGLNIYHKDGYIKAIAASDGHCVQVLTNGINCEELSKLDSFIASYNDCKKLSAIFDGKHLQDVSIVDIHNHIEPIDGSYPDIWRVIPSGKHSLNSEMIMGINYKYLAKISQSMTKLSKGLKTKHDGAVFTFYGAEKAIKVEVNKELWFGDVKALFVIMPMLL